MKIAFLDFETMGDMDFSEVKSFGEVFFYKNLTIDEIKKNIKDVDIIVINKINLTRDIMESAPKLKLICISASGTDNIDLEAAKDMGIEVKNAVGYSTNSVAQTTIAMLLSLLHHIGYYDSFVKSGDYSDSGIFSHFDKHFWELSGKTTGIIGLGKIGLKTAEILSAFGSKVIYFSPSGKDNTHDLYKRIEKLDDFLSLCDVVCIHAGLNYKTENLITKKNLCQMKPSSILVNTGRGGVVNEADLSEAIDKQMIAGAAIDVFCTEPIPKHHPYLKIKNKEKILLTPHIAWLSYEAQNKLIKSIENNISDFLNLKNKY